MNHKHSLALLSLVAALCTAHPAWSQVAGGTTSMAVSVSETTQLAMGWSVKKTLMGKNIYNEAGQKIGKVDDLIISPDKNLSYVIVGAGGFVGIGRHDVAIPVGQIQDKAGKLTMAGATKESIKAMPQFEYVSDSARRDRFMASAEKDIASARTKLVSLEKKAGTAASETKAKIGQEITTIQGDMKTAQDKLGEMKQAGALRWKEFENGVSEATARLRKSIDTATS